MEQAKNTQRKKRWIAAAALLAALAFLLGAWALHRRKTVLNLDRLTRFLLCSSCYSQGMRPLEEPEVLARYPGITQADFSDFRVYAAEDGSAREFALFHADGRQGVEQMMPALSLYCHARIELLSADNPQEAERVRGYQIRRTREYVLLLISDPQGTGAQLLTNFFRQSGYDFRD